MLTILVLTASNVLAHVVRPLEVGKILRSLGHEIIFAGDGLGMKIVRETGFEVYPLPELDVSWVLRNIYEGPQVLHPVERIEQWVKSELKLFDHIQPDAILDDARLTAGISTEVDGLRRICIQNAHGSKYAVGGLFDYQYKGPPPVIGKGIERQYNQVRKKYGLSPVDTHQDLFIGLLNLLCDVPEYAPSKDLPEHFVYIGPITWEPNLAPPPWMSSLDPDRPTIYFTMGSTGPEEAYKIGIEAFKETEYQVMMTLGSRVKVADLTHRPQNIFVTQYGPGEMLAQRADVVICHAGNGTSYQALGAGKPIVSFPFVADQQWQAMRQAELGVGVTIHKLTPSAFLGAVEEIFRNPEFKVTAERFQSKIMTYNGPETAASLILEYLDA